MFYLFLTGQCRYFKDLDLDPTGSRLEVLLPIVPAIFFLYLSIIILLLLPPPPPFFFPPPTISKI